MEFMFHADGAFSYETLRAVSYTPYDGADVGEVMATAARVREGDWESWHTEWLALAGRTERIARHAREAGHVESARAAYLRAANYYRTAEFFLRDDPDHDPRLRRTWQQGVDCFSAAAELAGPAWRRITIPYAGVHLEGYFFQAGPRSEGEERRPTLLAFGGFDSTVEEMYFTAAAPALRRGWNCLIFEGPGQGAALRRHGLRFRPDWEAVVSPVVDLAVTLPGVDPDGLALLGMSFGGYLAPRAAAFEHRIAACVAFDGVHNLLEPLRHGVASGAGTVDPVTLDKLDELVEHRRDQPTHLRWMLSNALWTFGVSTAHELVTALARYDLTGTAEKITCPTLVLAADEDHFFPGQPERLYDALTCAKDLITFTAEEGGEEHCHMGALALFHQRLFDWLDETLKTSV